MMCHIQRKPYSQIGYLIPSSKINIDTIPSNRKNCYICAYFMQGAQIGFGC